jgi:serine O-acetyltransferase
MHQSSSGGANPAPLSPSGDRNANPESLGLIALLREDFETHERDWASQGFAMLAVHRFGNWRMDQPKWARLVLTPIYRVLNKTCQVFCGIMLPYCVPVGRRVKLEHFGGMILSARSIGNDVTIRQNTTMGIASKADLHAKPTIEDGVDIGCNAVIIGNITIGKGAVIGAGAVVIRDVPPYSVVAGVPAKVIRTLTPSE